jgi:hypothetical protein
VVAASFADVYAHAARLSRTIEDRIMHRIILVAVCASVLSMGSALAQSTSTPRPPQVIRMTVTPAKAPVPALKYHLLPEVRDLKSGNAAIYYHRANTGEWWGSQSNRQEVAKLDETLDQPWQKSLAAKYDMLANSWPVKELSVAARCETCDWQMLERVRADGPLTAVPDLMSMRNLGKLNAARARSAIHRGDFETAIHSLQSGFALSKHVGEAPVLINAFVGSSIANGTLDRVQELIQQPGAPNLYWALTDLPGPLLDLRRPLQSERLMLDSLFPEVRQALRTPKATPLPGPQLTRRLQHQFALLGARSDPMSLMLQIVKGYPAAKDFLLQQGRKADEIDALPVTQVVLMHQLAQYEIWSDETNKLSNLPYWEARPRWRALQRESAAKIKEHGTAAILEAFFRPTDAIFTARVRTEQRIAILRCVEAIRLHAATHENRLPESLEVMRATPIPVDPMTGKAFGYRVQNDLAILEAAAQTGDDAEPGMALRIEIQLATPLKQ